jgi:serine/threonine protein kinase/tetratricopeptide (TPR) repeat protein
MSEAVQPQTVFADRYVIGKELGRGGMATVYLAHDLKNDRDVAVKVLHTDLGAALGAERFEREIHVVSRFSHPNILAVDDSGETAGQLWYVMPLVRGETLRTRLDREKQLPLADAVKITCEVAEALYYAHQQGIIHRDIKPENILLEEGHAIVADFGIARAASALGERQLTQTGVTLGTPAYMSPEQGSADKSIDGRADIYSLGCVLYELLAGEPPFGGPTAQVIIARHSLAEVPALSIARGTVPEELEDAILRSLAKSPADRFATALEFSEALKESLASDGKSLGRADRRSRSRRGKKKATRSKRSYIITAAIALPVVAGLAFAGFHYLGSKQIASRIGTDSDPNHVAVLYFDDRSEGNKLRPLAEGLTEALIDELSAVKQLKVISRNGVAPFKGRAVAPDSLQRTFKIGTLVTGTVAESGDRLRVGISLVDALTGDAIGSATIEQPRSDLFKLQDSLAKQVSFILRKKLGSEIEGITTRPGTRNAEAWEAFQHAEESVAHVDTVLAMGGVQAALQQLAAADSELAKVETMDKKWAVPLIARGWIPHRKVLMVGFGDPGQIPKLLDKAGAFADTALALSPSDPHTLANALELRGTVRLFRWLNGLVAGDAASAKLIADAEADYRASIKANPLQASAWNALSYLLIQQSRTSQAKLAAQSAYDSDPYLKDIDKTIWRLFQTSLDLNVRSEATKWCDLGRQRLPQNFRFTECRLSLSALPGPVPNIDSVWAVYHQMVALSPAGRRQFDSLRAGMFVGLALVRAHLPDSARAVAARSRGNPQVDPATELLDLEAKLNVQLGNKDEAIRLETRYLANNPQLRAFFKFDESWWWDPVRDDPRFKALMAGGG